MLKTNTKYHNISDADFTRVVIEEKQPTVIVFGADWSGNSEIMDSVIGRVSGEFNSGIQFLKVDIDEQTEISNFFGIHSVPTILMLKEGEIMELVRGFLPAKKMRQKITQVFLD